MPQAPSTLSDDSPDSIRRSVMTWNEPFRLWVDFANSVRSEDDDADSPLRLRKSIRSWNRSFSDWGDFACAVEPAGTKVSSDINRLFQHLNGRVQESQVDTIAAGTDTLSNSLLMLSTMIQVNRDADPRRDVREQKSLIPVVLRHLQINVNHPYFQGTNLENHSESSNVSVVLPLVEAAFAELKNQVTAIADKYKFTSKMREVIRESLVGVPFSRLCDLHRELQPDDLESKLSLVATQMCRTLGI